MLATKAKGPSITFRRTSDARFSHPVQCSRDTPVCLQCRDASATCVPRGFGPTLDNGEVASETGIEALKGRIRSMQQRLQKDGPYSNSPTRVSPRSHLSHREGTTADTDVSPTETLGDQSHHEMQDDVAYLSLSAMAERTDSQVLSTEGLSYLTMLYAATGVSGSDPTLPLHANEALSGPLAELQQNKLPDVELCSTEMCAAYRNYSDMIGCTFPYMTAAELTELHDNAILRRSNKDGAQPPAEHLAIAYLGTATGLLLGAHYRYKEMLATNLALRAVRLMPRILDYAGKLSSIHCLTALVIFSMYSTFGGSTWHLLGLTMTRCISAGLHTLRFSDHRSEDNEQRAGSRLLWTLYILDAQVLITTNKSACY
jgi:hypothetical protein